MEPQNLKNCPEKPSLIIPMASKMHNSAYFSMYLESRRSMVFVWWNMLHTYYNKAGTMVDKLTEHVSLVAYLVYVVPRYGHDENRSYLLQ